MKIKLNALDTLFFRDGKPFSASEETWADGMFPPFPSVFYGALRTAYFSENISQFPKANNKDDPTLNLKIDFISLNADKLEIDIKNNKKKIIDGPLFPVPLDLVAEKDKNLPLYRKLNPLKLCEKPSYSNCKTSHSLETSTDKKVEAFSSGFLTLSELNAYLSNEKDSYDAFIPKIYIEPKVGITRNDNSRTSEEQKLYRVGMYRMPDGRDTKGKTGKLGIIVGFDFALNGSSISDSGFFKLGGEGKAVRYNKLKNDIEIVKPQNNNSSKTMFKLYFATPVIFEKGWFPDWIDKDTMTGEINGLKLKLIAAACGKYQSIGGWDMKNSKPKPMLRAVPAGSVYYFEIIDGTLEAVINQFHGKAISDEIEGQTNSRSKEGFGICYVGRINDEVK